MIVEFGGTGFSLWVLVLPGRKFLATNRHRLNRLRKKSIFRNRMEVNTSKCA